MIDLLSMIATREGCRPQSAVGGAWDREARAVITIAAVHGLSLREDDLIYLDVRDLQALRWRIESHREVGHHPRAPRAA